MEQNSLPIKTKIVAWVMMIIGAIGSVSSFSSILFIIFSEATNHLELLFETPIGATLLLPTFFLVTPIISSQANNWIILLPYFVLALSLLLIGFLLLKRCNKILWKTTLLILFLYLISNFFIIALTYITLDKELYSWGFSIFYMPPIFISLTLTILLLLDRKKYKEAIKNQTKEE